MWGTEELAESSQRSARLGRASARPWGRRGLEVPAHKAPGYQVTFCGRDEIIYLNGVNLRSIMTYIILLEVPGKFGGHTGAQHFEGR